MADTGEDREVKPRTEAKEAEVIRKSKKLVAKTKQAYQGSDARKKAGTPKSGRSRPKSS